MYVCICKAVTDRAIREAVYDGTTTMAGLRKHLGCTGQCARCATHVKEIRDEVLTRMSGIPIAGPVLATA